MPLPTPSKIVCVGRNYAAHARELGNAVPERPLLFLKPPSAIIASGEAIRLPAVSRQVEYEAEIGVVVGPGATVHAIVPVNDVTARDLQKTDGQWTRAKGFDTFCPVGEPVAVPRDFDLASLEVIGRVNGTVRQHGHARDMVFAIPDVLAAIAAVMTLVPGDLVLTGTPDGVGPLAAGDMVEVEIPGFGVLRNPVRAA